MHAAATFTALVTSVDAASTSQVATTSRTSTLDKRDVASSITEASSVDTTRLRRIPSLLVKSACTEQPPTAAHTTASSI
jgi:hypothetical protein